MVTTLEGKFLMAPFGLMKYNRIKWNRVELNGINIQFHCLNILKRRGTKLKVSDGMGWNSFHPIQSITWGGGKN
jgi:hypothetical protein